MAELLTGMMDSPVLVVPELAQVPQSALAKVYVFTNGVAGTGPMGFQPDVFDTAPGDDGYSPLRALQLVTWEDAADSQQLTSAREVEQANGESLVRIEQPGVVVNMPFITWPGGRR